MENGQRVKETDEGYGVDEYGGHVHLKNAKIPFGSVNALEICNFF